MVTPLADPRAIVRYELLPFSPRRAYAMVMPAPAARTDWTVEEMHALPDDGNRYEVVDGELLVTPAPSFTHQDAIAELYLLLKPYADAASLHVLFAPAAVTFSPRREVQPDLLVLPLVDRRRARTFAEAGRLVLAVETLSPSTARADRYTKRRLYQSENVPEYWIVDVASRLFERWRPNDDEPEVLHETLAWQPCDDLVPLVIDLAAYFRRVHGV